MTEDPRIEAIADVLDSIPRELIQRRQTALEILVAIDANDPVRSRLQAAEDDRRECFREASLTYREGLKTIVDLSVRAEAAEASLARVTREIETLDRYVALNRLGGRRDEMMIANALEETAQFLRAALAGGTGPEPTEPTARPNECPVGALRPVQPNGDHGHCWHETGRRHCCICGALWPVDVASEPPNPPALCQACGWPDDCPTGGCVFGHPIGEPLKPTEQDERGLINGLCGCEMWPSGLRCTIRGNHVGPHRNPASLPERPTEQEQR